jgi:hypothetical protein
MAPMGHLQTPGVLGYGARTHWLQGFYPSPTPETVAAYFRNLDADERIVETWSFLAAT